MTSWQFNSGMHERAFGGPAEAKLVRLITERKKALIALVALSDGTVIGKTLFLELTVANAFAPLLLQSAFLQILGD